MPCNTPECGCVDCIEPVVTPPCTTCECNPGFCDDGCADYPQTQCFIYNGPALPCLNVETGESLNTIFGKIDTKYCSVSGEDGSDKWVKVSEEDTQSGYLTDKINIADSTVTISLENPGGDEKLKFDYTESGKVKVNAEDPEAKYLIEKVALLADPLGVILRLPVISEDNKVKFGYSIDYVRLCELMKANGCIPEAPVCDTVLTGLQLTGFPNGNITVQVGYTGTASALYEVSVDGGQILLFASSNFTITGQATGVRVITVKGECANGVKTNTVHGSISIPAVDVVCPSVSVTASDNTVGVAWSVINGYTYNVEISTSEFGAPFQSGVSTTGSYVFTALSSAVEYWVRVIPTYLGVTKTVCFAQSIITTQDVCNATVSNIIVYNPLSNGTVTLSWSGSGASSYDYRIGISGAYTNTTANSVNLTSQAIGTHTFFVKAKCSNGLYGTQAQADFIIPAASCSATIDSVTATSPTEAGTVTLSWTATGATSYEYRLGSSGSWVPTSLLTIDLNNQSAGLHTFYVRSRCANGLYGGSNSTSYTIPDPVCNAVVSNLVVSNTTSSGNATVSWTGTGAASYEYRLGSGAWVATIATTVNLTGLADGTQIVVRGKCTNGLYGNSITTTITIPSIVCSAPGQPTLSDVASNTYSAEWTFTDVDPYAGILAGTDGLSYPHSTAVSLGSDLVANYGAEGNNKFLVQRIAVIEQVKTIWFNTPFNNGTIVPEDSVYRAPVVRSGWTYYITRDVFTFDSVSYSVTLKN